MRFYIPATISDLAKPDLPIQRAFKFAEPPNASSEEIEVEGEQMLYEAAFASLELVYDLDESPLRVVIVAEESLSNGSLSREILPKLDWTNVQSIHIDGESAQALITRLQQAESQSEADELVSRIDEEPLEWFAPEERWQIVSTYRPMP